MRKKRKCTKCRGHGKVIPPEGTRADAQTCNICKGSGVLPEGYIVNKQGVVCSPRYYSKREGLSEVEKVEAV